MAPGSTAIMPEELADAGLDSTLVSLEGTNAGYA